MSELAVLTEGLGKKYRLGVLSSQQARARYDILGFALPLQRLWPVLLNDIDEAEGDFWALKDLNLEVARGEVLGIVGRNGSGKSTLLKILARVTEPSTGFADVTGKVGSLLEVGTGFHAELTGRQNVYLNGSIMGMSRDQIAQRLDDIVDFAEVGAFIATPVKNYSSGMYMRLAFSVAAHMECDILIVDEVLAVGDAHFQKKCLGRIEEEVKAGKTVLFVSHNMNTIMQVCTRCLLFENGQLVEDGLPQPVVESYLSRDTPVHAARKWDEATAPTSAERSFRLWSIRVIDARGISKTNYDVKEPILIEVEWDVLEASFPLDVHISLRHESGVTAFVALDNLDSPWSETIAPVGRHRAICAIPAHFLNEGMFMIDYMISAKTKSTEYVSCSDAATFAVGDDLRNEGVRGNWKKKWFTGILRPRLHWYHHEPEPILVTENN